MRDRLAVLTVLLAGAAGAASAILWWPGPGFVLIAAAYAIAAVVTMPTPYGAGVSATSAVAGAVALTSSASAVMVVGAAAASLPFGWLAVRVLHGRRVADDRFPGAPVGIGVFGGVFAAGMVLLGSGTGSGRLAWYFFSAALGFLAAALVRSLTSAQRSTLPGRLLFLRALQDWPAMALLFSTAALFAETVDVMGGWSVMLAGFPYIFGHVALHRLSRAQTAYDQTIRAFGRIPEAGGYVDDGHAERTAHLAVTMAAELGLSASALRRVEYAALLHDIGRLALANQSLADNGFVSEDVSRWSADIISEARFLDRVADLVRSQHKPYRRPGEVRDGDVPRAAQILRVAAAYDGSLIRGDSRLDALEALHRGAAYDYDPDVVMGLRRVLERSQALSEEAAA